MDVKFNLHVNRIETAPEHFRTVQCNLLLSVCNILYDCVYRFVVKLNFSLVMWQGGFTFREPGVSADTEIDIVLQIYDWKPNLFFLRKMAKRNAFQETFWFFFDFKIGRNCDRKTKTPTNIRSRTYTQRTMQFIKHKMEGDKELLKCLRSSILNSIIFNSSIKSSMYWIAFYLYTISVWECLYCIRAMPTFRWNVYVFSMRKMLRIFLV